MKPVIDPFFTSFDASINASALPARFNFPFDYIPHPLCVLAAEQLQKHIGEEEWNHNFGLSQDKDGAVIGKMFGVLVVKTEQDEIGYLAAFSGKLAGVNHHAKFVPPVFDSLTDNSFLNNGMQALTHIINEIKALEIEDSTTNKEQIDLLKEKRRLHSVNLQNEIFDHYSFLNQAGEEKSLREIFKAAEYKNPPSGAGECAAPKLLQYAFQHKMKPLAIAEFWWGLSPKSDFWKHGQYYPCCREKCEPILGHMLAGIEMDEEPRF